MSYKIVIAKPARKFIDKQPPDQQERILKALHKLPDYGDISPMSGKPNQYRVRIGTYRAVYRIDNNILTVFVIKVGNRGDVYKD